MLFRRSQKSDKQQVPAKAEEPAPDMPPVARRALLVVDGSPASQDAARYAIGLAAALSCELLAIFVIDVAVMDYLMQMRIFLKEEREEFEEDLVRKGRRLLIRVEEAASQVGIDVETILCKGRFHQSILQLVAERKIDTIIISGWKDSSVQKDLSSVERQLVLDQADCPVIVVKRQAERGKPPSHAQS
jgi:nucleotide-binding universal stress UspA family protein